MHVFINGKTEEFPPGLTLQALIAVKGLDPARVVAELNQEIVPGERFGEAALREGDRLELLQFVGGG